MDWRLEWDESEIFSPGAEVPAGVYRQCGNGREVILREDGYLPASLDGRVAAFHRPHPKWAEMRLKAAHSTG